MRIQILNDQNEVMENWYIGKDENLISSEVKEVLDNGGFVLAHDENEFRKIMEESHD